MQLNDLTSAGAYYDDVPTLGENIRKARTEAGISRRVLSRALGVQEGNTVVADLELGRNKNIGLSRLMKVARGLKRPIEDLIAGIDEDYDAMLRDLLRQTGTGPLPSRGNPREEEGHREAIAARLLEERSRTTEALLQIHDALTRLLGERGDLQKTDGTEQAQARQRRGA